MSAPTATYRLQLRGGMDFARVEALLPYLSGLGVSHLYLSPIFRAASGSTHGYDIVDPTEIEAELGGRAGFERLSAASREAGLGIVIDIVPNHTAFSPENPWLRDVMRFGRDSRYAAHFDIDWSRGRLLLPYLAEPFEARLAAGAIELRDAADGPVLADGPLEVPLRPASVPDGALDADGLRELHDAQAWRLSDWRLERDSVTHRRFFNITGLVGMRVEDDAVFQDMHSLVFDLADAGLIQGVRVDHVDGLADPGAYLRQLRDRLDDMPIWVEKILTGDEALPDWPIAGTTGYEAARAIARLLTDADGLAELDAAWRRETYERPTFEGTLARAKREVLVNELAAELHQLMALADRAAARAARVEIGPEFLREAIAELLVAFPRYRTYLSREAVGEADLALIDAVADQAAAGVRSDAAIRFLAHTVKAPATEEARAFRTRFQQVTGALLAKAHEDTAAFRYNRYLAANEVGAEPDHATMEPAVFDAWAGRRLAEQPLGLTLTSSHDTKRSEDARMRLVAISHLPADFVALYRDASARTPGAADVDANFRWYLCQSLLAIWEDDDGSGIGERLAAHAEKAMREAKRVTYWTDPVEAAEAPALDWARALAADWGRHLPATASRLIDRGAALSQMQLVLKMLLPGVPDIYQGAETTHLALTDPDNRRPVDFEALAEGDGRKQRLTRSLLRLRRDRADFFAAADVALAADGPGRLILTRSQGGEALRATLDPGGGLQAPDGGLWPDRPEGSAAVIAWVDARG